MNHQIEEKTIRLIDQDGTMVGIIPLEKGIQMAAQVGLDLVEISPNVSPPVCKILDYGKYKYAQQKKKAEAKKNQKVIEVKEIQLRPMINPHDLQVKSRAARKFLEAGNKVKVSLRFRGREMSHKELGLTVLNTFEEELKDIGKAESMPKQEGRQIIMILAPLVASA
jgi:translation initiation factor IF-3